MTKAITILDEAIENIKNKLDEMAENATDNGRNSINWAKKIIEAELTAVPEKEYIVVCPELAEKIQLIYNKKDDAFETAQWLAENGRESYVCKIIGKRKAKRLNCDHESLVPHDSGYGWTCTDCGKKIPKSSTRGIFNTPKLLNP